MEHNRKTIAAINHQRAIRIKFRDSVTDFSVGGFFPSVHHLTRIDLVTVLEAILTSGQPHEKLQCLYENLMSNNFRKIQNVTQHFMDTAA